MKRKIGLGLNSLDLFKHALFKDYTFPASLQAINLTQERILMTIRRSASLPMVTIARAIGLEKGPFSQTVDKLESMGLVARVKSVADKRQVYLALTPQGLATAKEIEQSMEQHFASRLQALTEQQYQDLLLAFEVLQQTANQIK